SEFTSLIKEGREESYKRLIGEAEKHGGIGIAGVTNELINHVGNIEFLSVGSTVHQKEGADDRLGFSSSADAQELYCQHDAGFTPLKFAFGNVAYSVGLGGGLGGFLKSLSRGEVPQFSQIFDKTRHLALERLTAEARQCGANAVVGVETTVTPFMGVHEMIMIGTASHHPVLANFAGNPVTSDMTCQEMWNMINIGYMPLRLVMGVSVYSLGVAGGIMAAFKSMSRGEIPELTSLIYEAREKALDRIQQDAKAWNADEVVGVKTRIYGLGGGLIEFMAIGTAVRKVPGLTTKTPALPPQAVMQDHDTYIETDVFSFGEQL
ncbi:MAG: heavy metal-binding domain-containing protein, partial [Elusimicrobia bacterium]|nr:heavy metal-binding domain-containing protein [Elusimicrobiota bacterium]